MSRVTGDPTFVLSRRLAGAGFRGTLGIGTALSRLLGGDLGHNWTHAGGCGPNRGGDLVG